MPRLLIVALVALVSTSACRRPGPSPQYTEAYSRFSRLVDGVGDAAYATQEMDQIVSLLAQVDPKSTDGADAIALQERIKRERARIAEEKASAAVPRPVAVGPPPSSPAAPPSFGQGQGVPAAAADAGPKARVALGADWAQATQGQALCLDQRGSIQLQGAQKGTATGWVLKDYSHCRDALPELVGHIALVRDGKVVHLAPASALQSERRLPDGGVVR